MGRGSKKELEREILKTPSFFVQGLSLPEKNLNGADGGRKKRTSDTAILIQKSSANQIRDGYEQCAGFHTPKDNRRVGCREKKRGLKRAEAGAKPF